MTTHSERITSLSVVTSEHPATEVRAVPQPRQYDAGILVAVLVLIGFGTVMVYSASIGVADMKLGDPSLYLRQHLKHALVALGGLALGMSISYHHYRRLVYPLLGTTLILLVGVLVLGISRGFSRRWLGHGAFEFQPAELAKLAFVIYLAYSLEKKRERMRTFAVGFLPHVLVCGLLVALCLAQPDLGTCILLGATMFAMLFVAGTRLSYVVIIALVVIPLGASYIANSSRRMERMLIWLDPWRDRYDTGFQTVNALTSLGSGGYTGMGLGAGRQKMGFLTQGWTDFIFSSIGEELGLIGCAAVAVTFLYLCWRGFRAARNAPDDFGRYLAFGVTALIGIQAAWNMGVAVGLLPTKGLNLPFVSGGGSSLLVTCFAAGILLNVSRWSEAPMALPKPKKQQKAVRGSTPKFSNAGRRKVREKRTERKPVTQHDSGVRTFVRPTNGGAA